MILLSMKRRFIPYNQKLVPLARKLRNNSTLSEVLLWNKLKKKQMMGYDFDRQKPIANYIVDFYSSELMLAIEIDGSSHYHKPEYDTDRQQQIEKYGITIIRFTNTQVKKRMGEVLEALKWQVQQLEE